MYRLYNPNSGEHFYTASSGEKDSLVKAGWSYEGIGWIAPVSGKAVYRLYNANAGDHHYTTSAGEKDALVKSGWNYEGICWRSGGTVKVYRQYNPNAKSGSHNYTTNSGEKDSLIKAGWRDEGIGWYAAGEGKTNNSTQPSGKKYPTLKEVGITGSHYPISLDAKIDNLLNDISSICKEAGEDFSSFTDYGKAYAIMNYVGENYVYGDGTTAEEMIDNGKGTCFAYSDLVFCMARKAGLMNTWMCIPGRPVSHGGNIYGELHRLCVSVIGGKYYTLDANEVFVYFSVTRQNSNPEEISESYARYLLGQTDSYTRINP